MNRATSARLLVPWLLVVAFFFTLSTLELRDRLDAPQRLDASRAGAAAPIGIFVFPGHG